MEVGQRLAGGGTLGASRVSNLVVMEVGQRLLFTLMPRTTKLMFQTLLSWKSVSGSILAARQTNRGFQTLLSWKSVSG